MEIGFNLPISGPLSAPETMTRIAQQGEALGYDYLTLTDHIVLPNLRVPGYPYSESGEFFGEGAGTPARAVDGGGFYRRENHPHPARPGGDGGAAPAGRACRQDAVDDRRPVRRPARRRHRRRLASGGIRRGRRHALCRTRRGHRRISRGVPEVVDRGGAALRRQLGKFDGIMFEPKPVQKPHPPIWVGGESGPSLRRAARLGDAWYPIGSNNKHLLDTLPRYRAGIARLRRLTAEAGRDPASVALTYRVKRYGEAVPDKASDGERRLFSGSTSDIVADLRALRDLGVAPSISISNGPMPKPRSPRCAGFRSR